MREGSKFHALSSFLKPDGEFRHRPVMNHHSSAENPALSAANSYSSYRRIAAKLKGLPRRVAAPSFVIPDTVGANCHFLEGLFPEVGLCLFETDSCLAYGDQDLPPDLPGLNLDYHVHLPLDLPWAQGAEAAAQATLDLVTKTAFLNPRFYVLHPPGTTGELERFCTLWHNAGLQNRDLLLENIEGNDLDALLGVSGDLGLSLCLDLGHMLSYEQQFLLRVADWNRVRMLHVNAPGKSSRHEALTSLGPEGKILLQALLEHSRPETTVMLEIFGEQGLFDSAALLAQWMEQWKLV
ncbi:putative uncharacterized protein [Desulfovibrio ferrophilus]|uniref:Xylose isomerase domain-containing protein TIM barrel n=1 Tax=Desulfovibrio ferrophilus TaxID=241368 RepID=A0A2Z6B2L7_9BACT|nr:putative uncharacterized protein [Desulfovibrio ferrophilus]